MPNAEWRAGSGRRQFVIARGWAPLKTPPVAIDVLIVPDKFKGTLTARQAAEAMAQGWRSTRPDDRLSLLPMSDGGDGFGEVLGDLLEAEARTVRTVDAAHRPVEATWWWSAAQKTAVIESAQVIGLAMLPLGKYHPFELDTFGLAAVLRDALAQGARRCLIGIGGSATNDAGFGLARGLGWQFCNDHEESISRWTQLNHLSVLGPPSSKELFDETIVAVDVQNPLLGPQGCSRVYGPQKGLTEFDYAERCLGRLAEVWARQFHQDFASVPGAGAAGGLGFGLAAFAGGRFQSGFQIFSDAASLEKRVQQVRLVLTGEGALDAQTVMGKGVGEIAQLCRRLNVPCLGLAGVVPDPALARTLFTDALGLTSLTDRDSALREPALWLERLAALSARQWST